jgi:hypothetical protein
MIGTHMPVVAVVLFDLRSGEIACQDQKRPFNFIA